MAENERILTMEDITVEFPGVRALNKVSFFANRGEVHILMGENGAGKSTIMKVLVGVNTNYTGKVVLNGEEITCAHIEEQRRRGVSMVFQEMNLLHNLTVAENIFLGRQPCKKDGTIDWVKMNRDARTLLDSINSGISERAKLSTLSVGEMQMVEIAKAVSFDSCILILDEPTSALTKREVDSLFALVEDLKKRGMAIIYISHRLEEIMRIGDRITILRDGENVVTLKTQDTTIDEIIRLMVGRELPDYYPRISVEPGEKLLEVKNLCQKKRLKNISLFARGGEITGLYGLMGAGRTELVRAIFGADKFDSGEILVKGEKFRYGSCQRACSAGIALLTEDRKNQGLIQRFGLRDNIALVNLGKTMDWFGINYRKERENAVRLAKNMHVKTPSIEQKTQNLSGGNQQKVVIAKWLNTNAEIIIFDEPTRGIDVGAKVEIYKIMNELKRQGKAIIMVSSELTECMGISDRLYVMYEGMMSACLDDVQRYTDEEILRYASSADKKIGGQAEWEEKK